MSVAQTVLKWAILMSCIAAVIIVGAGLTQSRQDLLGVVAIAAKMKTVCAGRLLIDLPREAEVEWIRPRVDGFDINSFRESDEAFRSRLIERETQPEALPERLPGTRNLETVKEIHTTAGLVGKLFEYGRTVTEGMRAKGLEIEQYRYEGIQLEALVHADGVSFDITGTNFRPKDAGDLPRLIAQLVPNTTNDIPAAPGFCIDHAYIRDPLSASQREEVVMAARLPNHPDIQFLPISAAGVKPAAQGLLERDREANARVSMAKIRHMSTIRSGLRTIGGIAGEELVQRFIEDNSAIGYSFWWEVGGTVDDVLVPHISFTMETGKGTHHPVPSSLPQGVALGLWDKISSSVRLRPNLRTDVTDAGS